MSTPWIIAFVAQWVVIVLLAVLVLGLMRRIGPVLERAERAVRTSGLMDDIDGLPVGAVVPAFTVTDDAGRTVDFADVGPADRVVLFVDQECPACTTLVGTLADEIGVAELPIVVVAGQGTAAAHYAGLARLGVPVVEQPDGAATSAFQIRAMPYAVAVADGAVVRFTIPGSLKDLQGLAAALLEPATSSAGHSHA